MSKANFYDGQRKVKSICFTILHFWYIIIYEKLWHFGRKISVLSRFLVKMALEKRTNFDVMTGKKYNSD